jgi:drug/metabolite transporter (DMT)-like permease
VRFPEVPGAALCATGMAILGASVAVSRAILRYPALTGQAFRYTVAAAILALLVRPGAGPRRRDLARLAVLAATGLVGFNLCLLAALRHADAAVVGTIVGCSPLVLAVAGPLSRRQRISGRLVLASAIVVAGAALVEGAGHASGRGVVAALGTLAGESLFSLLAAPLLPRLGAVRVSAWTCALAVPMLVVSAAVAGERPRTPTTGEAAALAYLALVLTVGAFLLWYRGLQRLGVARAGLFVGVLPMATVAASTLLDGRLPAPAQTFGVLVVGAGLSLPMILKDPGRYSASNSSGSPSPSPSPSSGSSDCSASARRTASA